MIGLHEGFSYPAIADHMNRNATTVMLTWRHWGKKNPRSHKSSNGQRNLTSAWDDRHLIRMAVMDHTDSSRQLVERWSVVVGLS